MGYRVGSGALGPKFELEELPDECPYCFKSITPILVEGHVSSDETEAEIFMHCPDKNCYKSFVGYYSIEHKSRYGQYTCDYNQSVSKGFIKKHTFSDIIENISSRFCEIYNEAYHAEQEELAQICGGGYRKALEVLIKDYIIKKSPEKKEIIISTALVNCIKDHIDNANIREMAKRAAWLGNDETHYEKNYKDKDVEHLKALISITTQWVEMEETTARYTKEMPDKPPAQKTQK